MADPDYIFIEGFDKYGIPGTLEGAFFYNALLNSGDWSGYTSEVGAVFLCGQPLAGTAGASFGVSENDFTTGYHGIYKDTSSNYVRTLGGVYFNANFLAAYNASIVSFAEKAGGALNLSIGVDRTTNKVAVWRGSVIGGTKLGESSSSYVNNSTIAVEWDITFNATTGIAKVWIDGVLEINLSGVNTTNTASAFVNRLWIGQAATSFTHTAYWDHLYFWGYLAAGGSETPLSAGFRVQTDRPTADSTPSQFSTRYLIGNTEATGAEGSGSSTIIFVGPFTVPENVTALAISFLPYDTTVSSNYYMGIYSSSGSAPSTLLATTPIFSGTTFAVQKTVNLVTPIALTAGQQIYLAQVNNGSNIVFNKGSTSNGLRGFYSFAPLPATAPTGLTVGGSVQLTVVVEGGSDKYRAVDDNPTFYPAQSYAFDATANDVQAFTFPSLNAFTTSVSAVSIKSVTSKSDAGSSRTARVEVDSGGTIGAGSAVPVPTSNVMIDAVFPNDPATGTAWAASAVNSAKGRIKVVS